MVPLDKVKEIINKHNVLEKELSSGSTDPKLFAKKSKEYSSLGEIISIARKYVNFENEKKDLQNLIQDKSNDQEMKDLAQKDLDELIQKKEKYGLESNKRSSLLLNNKIGIVGFGDLAKSLKPMLIPYTSNFKVYDPWLPNKLVESNGCKSASLKEIFKDCDVVYVLVTITTTNKNMIDKKLLSSMKENACLLILSRASVINFQDLNEVLKKDKIKVATDVFPQEPVPNNDPIRKQKNILFSAHRAGALDSVFFEMGEIVYEDLLLITKGLPPRLCRRAELETVKNLRSKPVDIN